MSKKDNIDTLDIEEVKVKDMTKEELIALVDRQEQALRHSEHVLKNKDQVIEMSRQAIKDIQEESDKTIEALYQGSIKLSRVFESQKDGISLVLQGLIKLLSWDDILNEEYEEKEDKQEED